MMTDRFLHLWLSLDIALTHLKVKYKFKYKLEKVK